MSMSKSHQSFEEVRRREREHQQRHQREHQQRLQKDLVTLAVVRRRAEARNVKIPDIEKIRVENEFMKRWFNEKVDVETTDSVCKICTYEMGFGEVWRMKCSHEFHPHCLSDWYRMYGNCPVCKHPPSSSPPSIAVKNKLEIEDYFY
ncbi:hypothetical protein Scep_008092 [Stephania cephalantha]|uniref:RING-type domain-containing protein n=1 Tax=Stephania cephalantha TaxID=152367 RepID=A0AAP0PPC1_9MAGN